MLAVIRKHAEIRRVFQGVQRVMKHAVGLRRALEKDFFAVAEQEFHARLRRAGSHVLGKNQRVAFRGFRNHVEVGDEDERGGLVARRVLRAFLAARDQIRARRAEFHGKLILEFTVFFIARNRFLPRQIRVNQGDVKLIHALGSLRFAEIGGKVNIVHFERQLLDVARRDLQHRRFVRAEDAFGHDVEAFGLHLVHALLRRAGARTPCHQFISVVGVLNAQQLCLKQPPDVELRLRCRLSLRIFRDRALPLRDGILNAFLLLKRFADAPHDFGGARVKRAAAQKLLPRGAGGVVAFFLEMRLRDQQFRFDNLTLRLAPLAVRRVFLQKFLPNRNRFREFALLLIRQAEIIPRQRQRLGGRHDAFLIFPDGLGILRHGFIFLQVRGQRGGRVLMPPEIVIGQADFEIRLRRAGIVWIRGEKFAQALNAEFQLFR